MKSLGKRLSCDHTCGKFFGNSQKNAAKTLQEKVTPNSLKLVTPTMIM